MLPEEQPDPFMSRPEDLAEPIHGLLERHGFGTFREVVRIGHDLFFGRKRKKIPAGQTQALSFSGRDPGPNMALNDGEQCFGKPELSPDRYADKSMLNIVRTGPADIVEEPAQPHQFTVNADLLHFFGKCNRCS